MRHEGSPDGPVLFDAHLHIIDPRFPLISNQGFLPATFSVDDYLARMAGHGLRGGAVVSGSFQGFDQSYLCAALARLGPAFVGVTQLPVSVSDRELQELHAAGVRALRFNLRRGGSAGVAELEQMARRVFDVVGWHVELYADAGGLADLLPMLTSLPALSIDHLGLSSAGLPVLRRLAGAGVRVKATGFGRVDFDVAPVLQELYAIDPAVLMFGTDLPSTRAPRGYRDADLQLVFDVLGEAAARRVLYENARQFYRLSA